MSGANRKHQILQYITNYYKENGYSPSYREIACAIGLRSPSTVHSYIMQLKAEGKLDMRRQSPRTIRPTEELIITSDNPIQRINLKAADGGSISFDCDITETKDHASVVRFSGILDATQLRNNVSSIIGYDFEECV